MKNGLPTNSCIEPKVDPKDYVYGGETAFDAGEGRIEWSLFLPEFEIQYQRRSKKSLSALFDTNSCVSFAVANAAEVVIKHLIKTGAVTKKSIDILEKHGFLVNGEVNISDRDLAARSGTTKDGNSFAKVCETLRTVGPIPESDHPFTNSISSFEEYMVPGPVLQEKRDAFKKIFKVTWEWLILPGSMEHARKIDRVRSVINDAPILVSSPVCAGWSRHTARQGSVIKWCGVRSGGHASLLVDLQEDDKQVRLDHYEPFVKTLERDYWINHAVRMSVVPNKDVKKEDFFSLPSTLMEFGDRTPDVYRLQTCLRKLGFQKVLSSSKYPYYGERTREAVLAFQRAHNVGTPSEIESLSGKVFGPKSLAKIRQILS